MKWTVVILSLLMLTLVFACSDEETATEPGLDCTEDAYEQNDSEDEFHGLGSITDCNGDSISITATICPDDDEDWFRVLISETGTPGCVLDPQAVLRLPDGITCNLSITYQCVGSLDTYTATRTVTGTGAVIFDEEIDCQGVINDSGYFHVRIQPVSGSSEEPYSLMIRG